jgi:hypothetical protein
MDMDVNARLPRRLLPAAVLLCTVACTPNLSPQSLVDKFRILAVRTTPASGAAGETITVETLMSDTIGGAPPLMIWAACLPLPGQSGRQCLESLAGDEDAAERFVLLGIEETATLVLPELAEGQDMTEVYVVLGACAGIPDIPDCECPGPDCEECLGSADLFDFCDGDDALAFKSVRAHADPAQGNQNPGIARILIGGEPWAGDMEPELPCDPEGDCERIDLAIEPTEGSAEPYTVVRFDEEEERIEEPYVAWFATDGSMGLDRSIVEEETGQAQVKWTPPEEPGLVKFYFVMYDGRGGVDFAERHARVVVP